MTTSDPDRYVVLVRHAKSAWPHGVPDHERPLAGKGSRNAKATGAWFAAEGPRPQLVLCSDATRARHTWEIVSAALPSGPPPVKLVPQLYGADPAEILELLQALPDRVRSVVVVGHQPTLGDTAELLAGKGSDRAALRRLRAKFPTNGVAVLRFRGGWGDLAAGGAVLETFTVPRASLAQVVAVLEGSKAEVGFAAMLTDDAVAKVSIVGVGIRSNPALAARMFEALAERKINLLAVTASEIKVSALIAEAELDLAVRVLHTAFGLDSE